MQRTVDDIKERAKYLRDMLAEYADDASVWLDNDEDMEYFIDEPAQEVVNKAITPHQDTTHEVAPTPATHPLVAGFQDNTETPADLAKEKIEDEIDDLSSENTDQHLANILADVPSRTNNEKMPAKDQKPAVNSPSDRFEKIAQVISESENSSSVLPTEMPKTPNIDEKGRKIIKSKETLKILNEMGREIEIGKLNDSMISKGTPLNACYCILEGRVRYYDSFTNEYLLGEGSMIGAAEVLAPNKIHFDYRTEGYVKVAIIDFGIIKSAIDNLRPLTRGIIKYTHDRIMGQKERSSHHLVDDRFINQLDRYNHFNIKEGEILFDVGDKSDTFFYISEGSMNVVDETGKVLANLTSGQSFGEIAALTSMPRTARLVAKTDTDLFEVRSKDVSRELSFEPPVIKLIVRGIINQLIINN
ncbi:6-phosphogluconolactonase protein [Candidatus Micropelagos thuwalensis]|uniref:6-phosphogluconolactonase protein n=1 Tax=Candidatus Micropelagius thuwalensis TaxID=1397666 RepID=U2XWV1_9PROT|nr:cyclic nucleotide-binding domain-containing protein [Candidatus Micropelagos thuwalensis]ERL47331.1 6-phosphogluconolactonase protein [Candidatus Micropelagos thuwalensis]